MIATFFICISSQLSLSEFPNCHYQNFQRKICYNLTISVWVIHLIPILIICGYMGGKVIIHTLKPPFKFHENIIVCGGGLQCSAGGVRRTSLDSVCSFYFYMGFGNQTHIFRLSRQTSLHADPSHCPTLDFSYSTL